MATEETGPSVLRAPPRDKDKAKKEEKGAGVSEDLIQKIVHSAVQGALSGKMASGGEHGARQRAILRRDPDPREYQEAVREAAAAGSVKMVLSRTSYIHQFGQPYPQLIKASDKHRVSVLVPAKIVRVNSKTGEVAVLDQPQTTHLRYPKDQLPMLQDVRPGAHTAPWGVPRAGAIAVEEVPPPPVHDVTGTPVVNQPLPSEDVVHEAPPASPRKEPEVHEAPSAGGVRAADR